MSSCLGVDRKQVRIWAEEPDFPGGEKGPWLLSEVFAWIVARERRKHRANDDPDLAGGDSPNLEEYRKWRARMAQLDFEARKGDLLPRAEIREGLQLIARVLRGIGDTLQRRFGPEAHAVLEDGLDDAEREINSMFGDDDSSSEDGSG